MHSIFRQHSSAFKVGKLQVHVISLRETEYILKESKYSEEQKREKLKCKYRFELIKRRQKQIKDKLSQHALQTTTLDNCALALVDVIRCQLKLSLLKPIHLHPPGKQLSELQVKRKKLIDGFLFSQ